MLQIIYMQVQEQINVLVLKQELHRSLQKDLGIVWNVEPINLLLLNCGVPYIAGNLTDLLTVPLLVAAEKTDIDLSSLSSNMSSKEYEDLLYHPKPFIINQEIVMLYLRLWYIFEA